MGLELRTAQRLEFSPLNKSVFNHATMFHIDFLCNEIDILKAENERLKAWLDKIEQRLGINEE